MKYFISFSLLLLSSFFFSAQAQIVLELYENGFNRPTDIANAGDGRLFVVEQRGVIRIIDENGDRVATPFLDIRGKVNDGQNEQGLLGLVFHPDYINNGFFFVNYTGGSGDGMSVVARYSVTADANIADPASEEIILQVTQPEWNHNGGGLAFGPDGYLYIGFGDGGSGGDPWGNGQNAGVMLGKMLRIDINGDLPYTIPADNPYVNDTDVLDEIWAIGLRNPWRYSFDPMTGDLWIGDVGQNAREEIDFQPASSTGGENYGWDCREGEIGFSASSNLCTPNLVLVEPVATYKESNFCNSVTGGYVYRGCKWPDMVGRYIYADYCNGVIWSILPDGQGGWTNEELMRNGSIDISTFGVDNDGELFAARLNSGIIYRVTMGNELKSPDIEYDGTANLSVTDGLGTYQWYLNGGAINGATSSTIAPTEEGDYTVEITYDSGCTTLSDAFMFIILDSKEVLTLRKLSIHPNPFDDQLNVDIELTQPGALQLEVLSMTGQKILTHDAGKSGQYSGQFDLSNLAKGVYFLRLITEDGETLRKLIKQ